MRKGGEDRAEGKEIESELLRKMYSRKVTKKRGKEEDREREAT